MSTAARQNYLAAEVLTAAPQKLHLLLIEGAIRFAEKARQSLNEGQTPEAVEALIRAQEIVTQMTTALDHEAEPALAGRMAAVYLFVFRALVEAGCSLDTGKIADALRVLTIERDTWRAVCGQSGQPHDDRPTSAGLPSPPTPHRGVASPAPARFSIDA